MATDAVHSTIYFDTFITVAPDSTATEGTEPPVSANPSVAARTYALIASAPYTLTSDDVIFTVWAERKDVPASPEARAEFFAKPQPCLRASDLPKRYGWGIHSDKAGRLALYSVGSPEYQAFASGGSPLDGTPVTVKPAMRVGR